MSEHTSIIRYDGPALAGHKMDVDDIAPALLALADLCKHVNEMSNADRASVRLYIDLDVEQHCAQVGLQVVQTFLDGAKAFFDDGHVVTAEHIFRILGITSVPGLALGLFKLIRMLRGRKPDAMKMVVKDGNNVIQINAGQDVYFAFPETASLLTDARAMKKAKEVVRPATKEGYEKVEFEDDGKVVDTINKEEAILIESLPSIESAAPVETIIPESNIRAQVKIRKAAYVGDGKWTIQYDRAREMSIEHKEWLVDFQSNKVEAPPGSLLDVNIRVSAIRLDTHGEMIEEPSYTITHVFGVLIPEPPPDLGLEFG